MAHYLDYAEYPTDSVTEFYSSSRFLAPCPNNTWFQTTLGDGVGWRS